MARINHNISAMITQGSLRVVGKQLSKSIEKLSTGLRINRASDDAAGLSVSEQLRTQVRGVRRGNMNSQDGISLLNIAEGALNELNSILQRMRELSIQSANDTLTSKERGFTNTEYQALMQEMDRITSVTQFNSMPLLDGTYVSKILHIGANNSVNDTLTVNISQMDTSTSGLSLVGSDLLLQGNATGAISTIDRGLSLLNTLRSDLGALVNRLEHSITNAENAEHNMAAAESVIRDVDFARESTNFTRSQILSQSATAMLAQANLVPQNVLQLLQ
jgi:flagellin